ncbi:MAG: hypothetical protein ACLSHO_08505 [Dysosmobacter sp.]
MRLPIRYAMTYPERAENPAPPLDLLNCPPLTFAAAGPGDFSLPASGGGGGPRRAARPAPF